MCVDTVCETVVVVVGELSRSVFFSTATNTRLRFVWIVGAFVFYAFSTLANFIGGAGGLATSTMIFVGLGVDT